MESISLEGKANFFESRVSSYQKAGFGEIGAVGAGAERHGFSTDSDF
jgi:ribonucleoside-diphosphate reductase subunit M2